MNGKMHYYKTCSCSGCMVWQDKKEEWLCIKCGNRLIRPNRKHNVCHYCAFEYTHMPIYLRGGHAIQVCEPEVNKAIDRDYPGCIEKATDEGYEANKCPGP